MQPSEQTEKLMKINQCAGQLIGRGLGLAFAESATAGRICADFSRAEHAGKFLKGGLVCYDAELKQSLLKVDPALISRCTPESPEVTQAITHGLAQLIPADIHIGCTGLTCPGGSETKEKPVGTMFFHGTLAGKTIFQQRTIFSGTADQIVGQSVDRTAELLLAYLSGLTKEQLEQQENTFFRPRQNEENDTDQWAVSWP